MSNELERLKAILSEKLPDAEVQALIAELTIASGDGSVSIRGDATEAVIVTGNKNIIGDNNQVVINHGTDPNELVKILHRVFQYGEKTAFARRTISHTMAMVVVDLMRLLYVAKSDIAREANIEHFGEFIDIAEQHFADLRNHIARSSNELDSQLNELSLKLDKRISFMLGRLKRGSDLHGNEDDSLNKMKQIGQQVDDFCTAAVGKEYKDIVDWVDVHFSCAVEKFGIALETASLNDIFRLRLYIQSQLLKNKLSFDGSRIFTIADDMDQDFGIYYFPLDKKILDQSFINKSTTTVNAQSSQDFIKENTGKVNQHFGNVNSINIGGDRQW